MIKLSDEDRPFIYAITDGKGNSDSFPDTLVKITLQVTEAVDENVSMVQIREKHLSGRHLFELASACVAITRGSRTNLLINDRADIASAAGADGVHLTGTSIPASVVRSSFGSDLIIGVSAHTEEEALAARQDGADFVVYGPVFETPGKGSPIGTGQLNLLCSALAPFPVIALGGINAANCRLVIRAGAAGVAGIRSFANRTAFRSLRNSLKHG